MRKHTIKRGESLSSIAEKYDFSGYEPIWIYNSKIKGILNSGNPDRIDVDVTIIIPKTAEQYEDAIKKLGKLRQSVKDDFQEIGADLTGAKRETDAFGEKLDLASDLAMIGKGAATATIRIGSKRLRNYVLKKKSLEAVQKVAMSAMPTQGSNEGMVVDKATGAAVDNSIMLMAKRKFDAAKAQDKFAKGMAKGMAKKGAVMASKAVAPVEHANGVAEVVSVLADVLIDGLEAVKPTSVAKTWIWATTGESPDDAYDKAKKHIAKQQQSSLKRVEETITKLKKERELLYP